MSAVDTVYLGLKLILYGIGFAVTVVTVGTIVDHAAGLLAGDPE